MTTPPHIHDDLAHGEEVLSPVKNLDYVHSNKDPAF